MENSNNSNCCPPTPNANTSCCSPAPKKDKGVKRKLGVGILGLAVILATTSAFKIESNITKPEDVSCEASTIESFEWIKTDKKVVFLLLKGDDESKNNKVAEEVKSVIAEINETDGSAYFKGLESESTAYIDLVKKEKIKEFPAVVVLGKNSQPSVLSGKISAIKLVRAYDLAAVPISSCSPSQKTSCCTKK